MLRRTEVTVNTTGSAGAASGSARTKIPINGWLEKIHVNYDGSAPGTTDLDIDTVMTPTEKVLNLDDRNTDGWIYPRAPTHDYQGNALLYAAAGTPVSVRYPINDYLLVSLAQCDALTAAVIATIYWEE